MLLAYEEARIFADVLESSGAATSVGANGEHVVTADRLQCTSGTLAQCEMRVNGGIQTLSPSASKQVFDILSIRNVWIPSDRPTVLKLAVRAITCQFGGTSTNWSQCRMLGLN